MNYPEQSQRLLDRLAIEHPLIQAPMVGVSTPELAAGASQAGALGSLGLSGGSPDALPGPVSALRGLTNRPVNLNFFCHETPRLDPAKEARWLTHLAPVFEALGSEPPRSIAAPYGSFDDNPDTLDALLALSPTVVSFHFGLPKQAAIIALQQSGCAVLASATSVTEAQRLASAGVDAIIAQGWEAGGHRGNFVDQRNDERLGTFALVPRLVDAVDVPIIAAGGISDGQTAAAALMLGAAGVQVGTAYVTCPESAASQAYRSALTDPEAQTVMTPLFSGRNARGLTNAFTQRFSTVADEVPDYPIAYAAGKAVAAAAIATGDTSVQQQYCPMWAGQAFQRNRPMGAQALTEQLILELQAH